MLSVYDIAIASYICTEYRHPEIYVVYFSVIENRWHNLGLIAPKLKNNNIMLLVANLAKTHGTHLRVLSESFPMNTNMTGLRWFSEISALLCI